MSSVGWRGGVRGGRGGGRYERQQQGWQRQTRAMHVRCEVRDLRLTDMRCEVRGVDGDRAAAADQGLLVTAASAASKATSGSEGGGEANPLVAHTHKLTTQQQVM